MKQQLLDLWRDVRAWCETYWLWVVVGCAAVCLVAIGAAR